MNLASTKYLPVFYAILAAALYGMSAPLSKMLLEELSPFLLSSLVYLGAGIGMLAVNLFRAITKAKVVEAKLKHNDMPYVTAMIVLDVAAPISLMLGITLTTAASAALLNNFEIVATSIFAMVIFKEAIGKRLWLSIALITIASIILTMDYEGALTFSIGSVLVLLSCVFWGIENNCTRKLSLKDPLQLVIIKGLGSGAGALFVTFLIDMPAWNPLYILLGLLLGFFAFGLSIYFYVTAQRSLGAARTSTYYAVAPFIGVFLAMIIFDEPLTITFIISSVIMLIGAYFAVAEIHEHRHSHFMTEHEHRHNHADGHHIHDHDTSSIVSDSRKDHTHFHVHREETHSHRHTPDTHHRHQH